MKKQLTREILETILQAKDITALSSNQITQFFLEEENLAQFSPDGICQIDPRNGDRIIFSTARARRPHDNRSSESSIVQPSPEQECLICQGRTTKVVDMADLSEGFTFINKNLFPIFYPTSERDRNINDGEGKQMDVRGNLVHGFHFLQWTSSIHDKDWHNMPLDDRVIVMQRLAGLEKKLLSGSGEFVSIIKNYGYLVGGSLIHGHQQIGVSNIMPNRIRQNKQFLEKQGETFSDFMLHENPTELVIHDYGTVVLITPYYMRRPYDMLLILKDTTKSYLHLLNDAEIIDVVDGWRDSIRIIQSVMPQIGKETAYNVVTHNGPGAGLYFEFLPYTQEMGGFEHLGLYLCQGNPRASTIYARESLAFES
jgi:galactose-1-phosphate uridylyltransferase